VQVASKVLIADRKWYRILAAVRDLGAHGVEVTLASDSWLAPAGLAIPRLAVVLWKCASGSFSLSKSDEVAWLVAAHSEALSRVFRPYTPRIESIVRILDKARLTETARVAGLDVPETRMPQSACEVEWSGCK
jgi:hypothetical protein